MLIVWVLTIVALCHGTSAGNPSVSPETLEMLRSEGHDEVFAKLLGIEDVSLVRASDERSEGPFYTNVSPLGDIMITKEQAEAAEQDRQGINFPKHPTRKWLNNEIVYWINRGDFSEGQRTTIHNAIFALSNRLTNVKIRPYQYCDKDYITIINGRGCWSSFGRIGGSQALSLQANGCLRAGTIQHELMHAAGFGHEHNRPDRDNYVKVLFENIPTGWQSLYAKGNYDDFGIQGDYDYYSLMHYPMNAPGTDKPAFEIKNENVDTSFIGKRWAPTDIDISKIDNLYTPQAG